MSCSTNVTFSCLFLDMGLCSLQPYPSVEKWKGPRLEVGDLGTHNAHGRDH